MLNSDSLLLGIAVATAIVVLQLQSTSREFRRDYVVQHERGSCHVKRGKLHFTPGETEWSWENVPAPAGELSLRTARLDPFPCVKPAAGKDALALSSGQSLKWYGKDLSMVLSSIVTYSLLALAIPGCMIHAVSFLRDEKIHLMLKDPSGPRMECEIVAESKRLSWCNAFELASHGSYMVVFWTQQIVGVRGAAYWAFCTTFLFFKAFCITAFDGIPEKEPKLEPMLPTALAMMQYESTVLFLTGFPIGAAIGAKLNVISGPALWPGLVWCIGSWFVLGRTASSTWQDLLLTLQRHRDYRCTAFRKSLRPMYERASPADVGFLSLDAAALVALASSIYALFVAAGAASGSRAVPIGIAVATDFGAGPLSPAKFIATVPSELHRRLITAFAIGANVLALCVAAVYAVSEGLHAACLCIGPAYVVYTSLYPQRRTYRKDAEGEKEPAEGNDAGDEATDDGAMESDLTVVRSLVGALLLEVLGLVFVQASACAGRYSVHPDASPFLPRVAVGAGVFLPLPLLALLGVLLQVNAYVPREGAWDTWTALLGLSDPSPGLADVAAPRVSVSAAARGVVGAHALSALVLLDLLARVPWHGFVELILVASQLGAYVFAARAAMRWA